MVAFVSTSIVFTSTRTSTLAISHLCCRNINMKWQSLLWKKKRLQKIFLSRFFLEITATREVEEADPTATEELSLPSYVPEHNSSYEVKRQKLHKKIFSVMSRNDRDQKHISSSDLVSGIPDINFKLWILLVKASFIF
ncbi:hypothetical protein AVEN_34355-1 [Araneus ventricosus]|uniref:Uncharacterized protein n=1 Tax=Araneus ventricosus TaxID=182803 RepID=A0A4Y2G5N3_ARAVE|nr:hypothetical protein AVEN_34355-1 [Araneus ventricosus]